MCHCQVVVPLQLLNRSILVFDMLLVLELSISQAASQLYFTIICRLHCCRQSVDAIPEDTADLGSMLRMAAVMNVNICHVAIAIEVHCFCVRYL